MNLRELFAQHRCDKGTKHGYETIYEPIFAARRNERLTLLEIGVYRGRSIAVWLDYFPRAQILAVDTFQRVPPKDVPILDHPRVSWFRMDSTREAPDVTADFIIDDGSHKPEAQLATYNLYCPLLKPNGMYFIEDVHDFEMLKGPAGIQYHDTKRHFDSKIITVPAWN